MKIILATGIYPPDIGGPATYVAALARELVSEGSEVVVVTYGKTVSVQRSADSWNVFHVPKSGGPLLRWWRYAQVLKRVGKDANAVIAFSSVSAGVPVWMSKLKTKKILRLGGDFFWERYTDRGGMKSLRQWYESKPSSQVLMQKLLNTFDHIVFSTAFQQKIYEDHYEKLPAHSVIENAVPSGTPVKHEAHKPFRLVFMGRFVGFKNLPALIQAVSNMSDVSLTLVGDGPMKGECERVAQELGLQQQVVFVPPVHGEKKQEVFASHDLLVIPSITEISPNVALEARAAGLPVLLSDQTGLGEQLRQGMTVRDLSSSEKIVTSVKQVKNDYETVTMHASQAGQVRGWHEIATEIEALIATN